MWLLLLLSGGLSAAKRTDNLAVPSSMFDERVEQLKRHMQLMAERELNEETAVRRVGYVRLGESLSEWRKRAITADARPTR